MKGPYVLSPGTGQAVELLGSQIRLARLERHWTIADLAERVGVYPADGRRTGSDRGSVVTFTYGRTSALELARRID